MSANETSKIFTIAWADGEGGNGVGATAYRTEHDAKTACQAALITDLLQSFEEDGEWVPSEADWDNGYWVYGDAFDDGRVETQVWEVELS